MISGRSRSSDSRRELEVFPMRTSVPVFLAVVLVASMSARLVAQAAAQDRAPAAAPPAPASAPTKDAALEPGPLPPPPRAGGESLVEALWARRSVRQYADAPVTREDLAFVLWAASGVNRPAEKRRTFPSAWGSNSVSVYLASADGVRLYDPEAHALKMVETSKGSDARPGVAGAEFTRKAPVVLVLVTDLAKFKGKAPPEKLLEMAHCEAGAISQNIYLAAAARGLGTVVTADVRPEASKTLGLGADEKALYTLPLGHPAPAAATAEPAKR
jgi:nitroreductase